jgi:hypothetical protein
MPLKRLQYCSKSHAKLFHFATCPFLLTGNLFRSFPASFRTQVSFGLNILPHFQQQKRVDTEKKVLCRNYVK